MKIVKCLIVDDEPIAREIVATHLNKVPNWEVVTTCINAEEAYESKTRSEAKMRIER